jgi:hypothetical protein
MVRGRAGERPRLQLAGDVDQLVALGGREGARAAHEVSGAAALGGRQRAQVTTRQQGQLEDRDDLEQRESANGSEHCGEATQLK